ncbi:MAG: helix-turn-helix transcriptional regulator [Solibacillus sp.]
MGWNMTKPKRKKKRKEPFPSQEFASVKGPKRERLIAERKVRGLTQAQLGEAVGCSTALISHLEVGRANPSVEVSMQLERFLEISFFELFPDL